MSSQTFSVDGDFNFDYDLDFDLYKLIDDDDDPKINVSR